jgi:hypothetical protein
LGICDFSPKGSTQPTWNGHRFLRAAAEYGFIGRHDSKARRRYEYLAFEVEIADHLRMDSQGSHHGAAVGARLVVLVYLPLGIKPELCRGVAERLKERPHTGHA